jgi:hypothetical protein
MMYARNAGMISRRPPPEAPNEIPSAKILNFENFPCGSLPGTYEHMRQALPCPNCKSDNIIPVSDYDTPSILAIACEDCGTIEGDAPTFPQAVANWNRIKRAL